MVVRIDRWVWVPTLLEMMGMTRYSSLGSMRRTSNHMLGLDIEMVGVRWIPVKRERGDGIGADVKGLLFVC